MGSLVTVPSSGEPPVSSSSEALAEALAALVAAIRSATDSVPAPLMEHAPPLVRAVTTDDREAMRRLVESEDGLNVPNGGGKTPLHWAVLVEEGVVLQSLLAFGRCSGGVGGPRLHLDAAEVNGFTALHYAAVTRNSFATHLLLQAGATVDCREIDGQTPLMKAARWDDVAQCRALLAAGADAAAADRAGRTALQLAAAAGTADIVRLLLERGARAEAADKAGRTALNYALRHSRLDAARLLLPTAAYTPRVDNTGRTELHWAAANGTADIVQRLLSFGPPRWHQDMAGMTPLLRALQARNEATATCLLDAPSRHKRAADRVGMTALHWAARAGLPRLLKRLLEEGGSAWTPDHKGRDALMLALLSDDEETVAVVLGHDGFRQRADNFGKTALHLAATRGHAAIALNLLQHGADTDVRDFLGWTPLACAVYYKADAVVDVLRCYSAEEEPVHHTE
ncbi:serine/threonine-protein phosphatase 6 regulatory ankyrin repeat subunit C-like [Schistocerca gregaria]|uniref:serine/threonine-protein phosphatase 6 regulatory ankyrin repeat subunit C-like n=1 Tax=Schistocerca gregaria TaxID=7010 RepID=UPI00211EE9B0|nr:serine/threonine-protein phosphatase 6 regulatory ankyrin repeat subunit C-like [Schistocerca gregaria]